VPFRKSDVEESKMPDVAEALDRRVDAAEDAALVVRSGDDAEL